MENKMIETETTARTKAVKRLSSKTVKFLIGGILVALTAGYLIVNAAQGSAAYYMTISEVQEQGAQKRNVRVAGNIVGESIVWEPRDLLLQFTIADDGGQMPVVYHGARPDMFRDDAELVIEGKLGEDGVFQARTIILKCPSKYEEAQ
jgi:cytochrome c-type biogenesis protein CcmE